MQYMDERKNSPRKNTTGFAVIAVWQVILYMCGSLTAVVFWAANLDFGSILKGNDCFRAT